jgi:hypothetical protein
VLANVLQFSKRVSAVAQLHQQNHQRQTGGDNVGNDDGPGLHQDTVNQPKRHARREQAVHAQRNAAHIAGAEGVPGLRHKAGGRQDGGHRADPVDEVHGVRVRCWGAGLVSAGLPCCLLEWVIRCRFT